MRLTAISGLGAKAPACFLVETGERRFLLDLGEGPDPGVRPALDGIGPVDAVLLSHGHGDHAGALDLRARIGDPPVWATATVLRQLSGDLPGHRLPASGETEVLGVRVTTGRSGHAPGGVWIHLGIGDGLLYTGDCSVESPLYAYDPPPPAGTLILDGSYGDYETSLAECEIALLADLDGSPTVLPVPAGGRGPEIALRLMALLPSPPALDDANRSAIERLAGPDRIYVREEALPGLERLLAEAPAASPPASAPRGVTIAATPGGASGLAAALIEAWAAAPAPAFIFTGYVPRQSPAETLMRRGRAHLRRWNVHPRLSDNAALVCAVGARQVLPAFGDAAQHAAAWRKAFAPARVVLDRVTAV